MTSIAGLMAGANGEMARSWFTRLRLNQMNHVERGNDLGGDLADRAGGDDDFVLERAVLRIRADAIDEAGPALGGEAAPTSLLSKSWSCGAPATELEIMRSKLSFSAKNVSAWKRWRSHKVMAPAASQTKRLFAQSSKPSADASFHSG
jgi:hypothetical protein